MKIFKSVFFFPSITILIDFVDFQLSQELCRQIEKIKKKKLTKGLTIRLQPATTTDL